MKKNRDAYVVDIKTKLNKEHGFLLMSDVHFDSKYCDRKLLKKHLDHAKENGFGVFLFGDTFDCMGGKYDRRSSKEDLRPEYQVGDYFNAIVDDAANFFFPYADIIEGIGDGNHEISVRKHHEIDLTKMLAQRLNTLALPYSGFIRFKFESKDGGRTSRVLYFNHGSGGNSPVTKGVISTNRRQVQIVADFFVSGHNHNEFILPLGRAMLTAQNRLKFSDALHINTGTYKREWGKSDFSMSVGFAPEVMGCGELVMKYCKVDGNVDIESRATLLP
jgi:hypothetical protein